MDRKGVEQWIDGYETAWRSEGTDLLHELFSEDVRYFPSPWSDPVRGLAQLGRFWDAQRRGPDESFTMSRTVLAVDEPVAVARVSVEYGVPAPRSWRDLWVVEFDDAGKCTCFEEWPFSPETDLD